ncbi:hypothetical protein [Maribacter sp. 2210JD10-5]|uniref:hypothetical protein n=1 Tax=Maribacter sp. 2210JD10-5 TaxID=3386272 RepID=UPI0039BC96CF
MDKLDYQEIKERIAKLSESTPRKFGKMTAQHIVEHLTFSVMFSNGKMPQELIVSEESAKETKEYFIKHDNDFEAGFKTPMLGEEPPEYFFNNLEEAKDNLLVSIEDFHNFFKENPTEKPINPIMGYLNYEEWIILHKKHFKHHFHQYGI